MKRALALLLLAAGCAKPAPPQEQPGRKLHLKPLQITPVDDGADRRSIATLSRGATIVARTGELYLEMSAVRAIDDDPLSYWMSPPRDLPQSITIALGAPARVTRVGIRSEEHYPANHVRFESTTDGTAFRELTTITAAATTEAQWFDVPPTEMSAVRVTVLDRGARQADVRLRSILIEGSELAAPRGGALAGCWSMNGAPARFERNGAHASGSLRIRDQPMRLDGGFDGRAYRFNWIRGNDFGYLLMSVSPDGRHLSGIEWHEEPIALFYEDSWFGERARCDASLRIDAATRDDFLRRTGRYSMFGLRFDDQGNLDTTESGDTVRWLAALAAKSDLQLIAHEFRAATAAANRARAERQLQSLRAALQAAGANLARVSFVAKGSDEPRQRPETAAMRALYSAVDVEIRR